MPGVLGTTFQCSPGSSYGPEEAPGKRSQVRGGLKEHPFLGFQEPPISLSPWQDRYVTGLQKGVLEGQGRPAPTILDVCSCCGLSLISNAGT